MRKLTHNPKGTPLPDNHPFKNGLIIFGQKRPGATAVPPSAPPSDAPPESLNDLSPEYLASVAYERAISKLIPPDE